MRRFFKVSSRLPVNEVFVQYQAGGGAFLRVELGGENIVARDGTAERRAVHGLADGVGRLFRLRVVTMHEIKIAVVRYALPQGMGHRLPDLVPAHLRHLEARAVVLQLAVELEAHHFAGQQAKAGRVALLAGIEQHLPADAHAHQRLARRGLQQRLQHARFAQAAHAVRHGALARQDDALGRFDVGHRAGNFHVGALKLLSPEDTFVYEYDWMPDGSGWVVTSAKGNGDNNWWVATLGHVDAGSGALRVLAAPKTQLNMPRVSGDGKTVAYIGGLMSDFGSVGGDIFTVPLAGGEPVDLTPGFNGSFNGLDWRNGQLLATAQMGGEQAVLA